MTVVGRVARLHRFPVKSMGGEELAAAAVDVSGIVGDRAWALRDAETGMVASAKRPARWGTLLDCMAAGHGDDVVVDLPDGTAHDILDPGLRIALNALFGRDVTIERATTTGQGVYDSEWPEIEGVDLSGEHQFPTNLASTGTNFVDMAAFHVLTTASLQRLTDLGTDLAVDIRRFRPNLVIDTPTLTGFAEDDWVGRTLQVGDEVELSVELTTPRCVMTTVAQGDLPRDLDVLRTLATHNRHDSPVGAFACLGVYASVARTGTIRAGDEVRVG